MSNTSRIKKLADEKGVSQKQMLTIILDVYELDSIDGYISQLRKHRLIGLDPKKINSLSVLFSYLASIFKDYT